ncbi:MAG: hypothetical protein M1819_001553 [Sarea resinae]|nr:MAG: hypothetical protein M1819_001553 [Sarea resinae]
MSTLTVFALFGALASAPLVTAHGLLSGIVADGTYYPGYKPSYQYEQTPPTVIGWSIPEDQDNGFVSPVNYTGPDIICHKGATPGGAHATVSAGSKIELEWTDWPTSHHGPVIDYLANCNGECETVDKTSLEFFKIDGVGLIEYDTQPGVWASDQLIANNNTWIVEIPPTIAPGNYVLRHEIIALHSAGEVDGAQNYPQCVNLQITGSGTDSPAGVAGESLYKDTDPGIEINIYTTLTTYTVPGPTLYSGAVSVSQGNSTGSATAATTTSAGSSSASITSEAVTSATSATSATSSAIKVVSYSASSNWNSSSPTSIKSIPSITSAPAITSAPTLVTSIRSSQNTVTSIVKDTTTISSQPGEPSASVVASPSKVPAYTPSVSRNADVPSVVPSSTLPIASASGTSAGASPSESADPTLSDPKLKGLLEQLETMIEAILGNSTQKRSHARDISVAV